MSLDFGGNEPGAYLTLFYQTITAELLSGVTNAEFTSTYLVEYLVPFSALLTNLARIYIRGVYLTPAYNDLIRYNALWLRSLEVSMACADANSWMSTSSDSWFVVYPRLRHLRVYFPLNAGHHLRPEISSVILFPSLVVLEIFGCYPFNDDIFFRGNALSLRQVVIPFHVLTQNIIGSYNVLVNVVYNRLSSITIGETTYNDLMELAVRDHSIIAQQVGQLAAATSRLVFQAFCTQMSMVESFQHPSGFGNLRQLEIAKRALALRDVVALLGALLGLVHLSCPLSMAHGCTNITDMGNRLSQLCPNTSSLNKSFRRWEMQIGAHVSVEYLAFGAMLIAALCPNFCLVRLSQDIRAAFKREIARAVSVAPFQQYAARIQSLTLDTGNAREKLGAGMDI